MHTVDICKKHGTENAENARNCKQCDKLHSTAMLRKFLPNGSNVYAFTRYVSRSGSLRHVALYALTHEKEGRAQWLCGYITGVLSYKLNKSGDALVSRANGMDAHFHIVSNLAAALYGDERALNSVSL